VNGWKKEACNRQRATGGRECPLEVRGLNKTARLQGGELNPSKSERKSKGKVQVLKRKQAIDEDLRRGRSASRRRQAFPEGQKKAGMNEKRV